MLKRGKVLYKWHCHLCVTQLCAYVIPSSDPSSVLQGVIQSEATILLFIWLTAVPRQALRLGLSQKGCCRCTQQEQPSMPGFYFALILRKFFVETLKLTIGVYFR